jgi:hypothetical protein
METIKPTRAGTTIIYENGIAVEINSDFVDALCKAQPKKYSRVAPGQDKPKKENLVMITDKKVQAPQKTDNDGKFTVEDLMQLGYKELQELGTKINKSKGSKINTRAKMEVLAKSIFEESNK